MIELGVPFSDPMADGSTIEAASVVAIKNGVVYSDVLKYAAEARRQGPRMARGLRRWRHCTPGAMIS